MLAQSITLSIIKVRGGHAEPYHSTLTSTGAIILTQNTLANMRDLKSALPPWPQANNDLGTTHRQSYNNPFMVLPTGRAIPPPACSRQHQTSGHDASTPVSCLPLDMFPKLNGKTGMGSAGFPNYGWPYDLPSNITTLDPIRRGYWSPDDKNTSFIFPPIGAHGRQDYYPRFPYVPAPSSARQCYMAGSIQPMKRADNKSYEMVNLDELVNQNPPIPRAVPALWTNQAGLSLGQCLQNPEGVTNVYIRGFMPETTDHHLECWASRFGQIESCKAIIEQDTGKCKGYVGHASPYFTDRGSQVWLRHVLFPCRCGELHPRLLSSGFPGKLRPGEWLSAMHAQLPPNRFRNLATLV